MMGVSSDLFWYLLQSVGRTGYMLAYGVMHHLSNPMGSGDDVYSVGITFSRSYRYGEFTQNVVQPLLVV